MLRRASASLLTVALSWWACVPGPAGAQGRPPADVDGLPALRLRAEVRLGSVDDPERGFSVVGAADVDRDGWIYVAERMGGTIRVFDAGGVFRRSFGREGQGPGEFRSIAGFGVVGDTVWVVDIVQPRITLLDRRGTVLSTAPMTRVEVPIQNQTQNGWVLPNALRPDGLFIGRMMGFGARVEGTPNGVGPDDTVAVPLVRFAPDGAVVDTLGWDTYPPPVSRRAREVTVGGRRYRVPPLPSGDPIRVYQAQGHWIVEPPIPDSRRPTTFAVTRFGERGRVPWRREYRFTPRRYTAEVLDSIAFGSTPPPATLSGRPPEDAGGATATWLVLGSDGVPRGLAELPRRARLLWVSTNRILVEERDEMDVPFVIRYAVGG